MKVKCISIKIHDNSNSNLRNHDLAETLELNKIYKVYRNIFSESYYYLIFDGSHLIEVPFQMFEIIENVIPNSWVINVSSSIISVGLEIFNEKFWLDDFSELSEEERIRSIQNLS